MVTLLVLDRWGAVVVVVRGCWGGELGVEVDAVDVLAAGGAKLSDG